MKEILNLFGRPVSFHRIFVDWAGGTNAALMLSQLVHWSQRTENVDCWVYKTAKEWETETGLTVDEQSTARKRLRKSGLVEEKLVGMPAQLYYRIILKEFRKRVGLQFGGSPQARLGRTPKHSYHTSYDTHHSEQPKGMLERNGFLHNNGEKNSHRFSSKAVDRFVNFTIENRINIGQKGSTRHGWKPNILKDWEKSVTELIHQVGDKSQVKEVLQWYFDHWRQRESLYIPRCLTLKKFCERFLDIQEAMHKAKKEEDSPPAGVKVSYEI